MQCDSAWVSGFLFFSRVLAACFRVLSQLLRVSPRHVPTGVLNGFLRMPAASFRRILSAFPGDDRKDLWAPSIKFRSLQEVIFLFTGISGGNRWRPGRSRTFLARQLLVPKTCKTSISRRSREVSSCIALNNHWPFEPNF